MDGWLRTAERRWPSGRMGPRAEEYPVAAAKLGARRRCRRPAPLRCLKKTCPLRNFSGMLSSIPVRVTQEGQLSPQMEILKGTLDVMVLQTLAGLGAVHGYGIARRIEQVSGDTILLNQGTIYAALVRLQQRGLIRSEWGVSGNNRKAKFYSLTKRGTRQLAAAAENWEQVSAVMGRFLAGQKGPASEGSL